MKTAINVTTNELTTILKAMPNSIGSFAKVLQFTEPKCNKKDRDTKEPFTSTIKKLSALTILVNTSYEKGIANAKAKEIAQGKEVTEYVKGKNTMPIDFSDSLNEFCGTFYGKGVIQYRPFENSYPTTKFFLNGKVIDKSKLPNVLPSVSKATNQGTEKEIHCRKLYVSNVRKIAINGIVYKNIECK